MNNLFQLKHLESKYKNVVIAHDTCDEEWEKGLQNSGGEIEKKQEEEHSGNYIYRVRGTPGAMTIVRLRRN